MSIADIIQKLAHSTAYVTEEELQFLLQNLEAYVQEQKSLQQNSFTQRGR